MSNEQADKQDSLKARVQEILLAVVNDKEPYRNEAGFTRWGRIQADINAAIDVAFVPSSIVGNTDTMRAELACEYSKCVHHDLTKARCDHCPIDVLAKTVSASASTTDEAMVWHRAIVALASGWDEDGAIGPIAPLEWETVARMAMDYSRAALKDAPPPATSTPAHLQDAPRTLRNAFDVTDPNDPKKTVKVVFASFAACMEREANQLRATPLSTLERQSEPK